MYVYGPIYCLPVTNKHVMKSVFQHLPPDEVLKALLREVQKPLFTAHELSGFLLDPSAGFLTKHQKELVYRIYQNVEQVRYFLNEIDVYQQNLPKQLADKEPDDDSPLTVEEE